MTVHMVEFGMCACSMEMPPSLWPEGHVWTANWALVTCPHCLAAQEYPPTFELLEAGKAIRCRRCGRTSHNQNDVEHHFCSHCQAFHDDIWPPARRRWLEDYDRRYGPPWPPLKFDLVEIYFPWTDIVLWMNWLEARPALCEAINQYSYEHRPQTPPARA